MFSTFVGLGRFINCQRPDLTSYLQKRQAPFYGFTVFTVFPYVGQSRSSLPAVGLCSA